MQSISDIFRHSKVQAPLARVRSYLGGLWRAIYSGLGLYRPFAAEEVETAREGAGVQFSGDIPLGAGGTHIQHRLVFKQPRPVAERVANLVVTPGGAGWMDGALYEKYSSTKPGLRLLAGAHSPSRIVPEGVFIQSEHIDTFGDWMSEYLAPLAKSEISEINELPVFLPATLAKRAYVERDAQRLGINFTGIDEPVLIERATVLTQPKVVRYWSAACVRELQALLKVDAPKPKPGSLLYLSRHGEASQVADRTHPSLLVEEIVKLRGGEVLRTCESDLQDFLGAGVDAETLLFDHGSAAYNMVYWQPRRVIEFVSDDWWMNSFLFFADALGIKDYVINRSDLPDISGRLNAALDRPLE